MCRTAGCDHAPASAQETDPYRTAASRIGVPADVFTDYVRIGVFTEIRNERNRQEQLRLQGKFLSTCATRGEHQMTEPQCMAVLSEEIGEAAKEVVEIIIAEARLHISNDETWHQRIAARKKALRKELIQCAAVIVGWIERLDSESSEG